MENANRSLDKLDQVNSSPTEYWLKAAFDLSLDSGYSDSSPSKSDISDNLSVQTAKQNLRILQF